MEIPDLNKYKEKFTKWLYRENTTHSEAGRSKISLCCTDIILLYGE